MFTWDKKKNKNKMADLKPVILIITWKANDQINALLKRNGLSDSDMLSIRNYVKYKDTNERMKKDIPYRHYSKENTIGYVNFRQMRLQNKENAS